MLQNDEARLSPTVTWYLREFGPILNSSDAAKLLGYRNREALRQARLGRRLPIPMFQISDRRGWFAATTIVASWIESTIQNGTLHHQAGGTKDSSVTEDDA